MTSLGINPYGKIELQAHKEFMDLWTPIVEEYKNDALFPWSENPGPDGIFRVKIDESTHIFDEKSELIHITPNCIGRDVTCIIDILKVYNFKGLSGLSCRVHQMKVHEIEYLFD